MTVFVSVAKPLKSTLPFMIKPSQNSPIRMNMNIRNSKKGFVLTNWIWSGNLARLLKWFSNFRHLDFSDRKMSRLSLDWLFGGISMKKCKADVKRTASAFIHFLGHQSILDHIMIKFWDNIEKNPTLSLGGRY